MSNIPFPIDMTLTPQNAHEHGYKWVIDVAYDKAEQIPSELYKDFQGLIADGYRLGCALQPLGREDKGLYEPLEPFKRGKFSNKS